MRHAHGSCHHLRTPLCIDRACGSRTESSFDRRKSLRYIEHDTAEAAYGLPGRWLVVERKGGSGRIFSALVSEKKDAPAWIWEDGLFIQAGEKISALEKELRLVKPWCTQPEEQFESLTFGRGIATFTIEGEPVLWISAKTKIQKEKLHIYDFRMYGKDSVPDLLLECRLKTLEHPFLYRRAVVCSALRGSFPHRFGQPAQKFTAFDASSAHQAGDEITIGGRMLISTGMSTARVTTDVFVRESPDVNSRSLTFSPSCYDPDFGKPRPRYPSGRHFESIGRTKEKSEVSGDSDYWYFGVFYSGGGCALNTSITRGWVFGKFVELIPKKQRGS